MNAMSGNMFELVQAQMRAILHTQYLYFYSGFTIFKSALQKIHISAVMFDRQLSMLKKTIEPCPKHITKME